ncbi:MAG: hypothetical protein QOJ20_4422 [Mycobacterium sp.]|nr:hypothetical protein [Mycobacterium sp.]
MNVREATRYRRPEITGLIDILDQHVCDRPDARALVFGTDRTELSYGALAALAEDMAARLGSTGLRRGDAVGLVCANTAEFVIALLGAARAGLVVAPLDPSLPESQMSNRLERPGAQAILVGPSGADAAHNSGFGIPTAQLQIAVSGRGTPPGPSPAPLRADG